MQRIYLLIGEKVGMNWYKRAFSPQQAAPMVARPAVQPLPARDNAAAALNQQELMLRIQRAKNDLQVNQDEISSLRESLSVTADPDAKAEIQKQLSMKTRQSGIINQQVQILQKQQGGAR